MNSNKEYLRVTEIFHSIQGESVNCGLSTVFIRLTGCPLRCQYCDTKYAFSGGKKLEIDDILKQITHYKCNTVCVTGGEPLAQPLSLQLLTKLCNASYHVSLETSGACDISLVDKRVMIVMDLKTPGSGEVHRNQLNNLDYLRPSDQIKFVLCHRKDYDWACSVIARYNLAAKAQVLFSPSWDELNPTTLANWILQDKINVRLQLQLHKILWGDIPGH